MGTIKGCSHLERLVLPGVRLKWELEEVEEEGGKFLLKDSEGEIDYILCLMLGILLCLCVRENMCGERVCVCVCVGGGGKGGVGGGGGQRESG